MLIASPLVLPLGMLFLPFRPGKEHKQQKSLRLIACRLSGNSFLQEDFRRTLSKSCVRRGKSPRLKQYEVYLKKWANFCEGRNIDPMQLHEKAVVLFLTDLFYKIESYSALNLARSALSTILCNDNGLTIDKFNSVKRVMKRIF